MNNIRARQYLVINNLLSTINASTTFILYAIFGRTKHSPPENVWKLTIKYLFVWKKTIMSGFYCKYLSMVLYKIKLLSKMNIFHKIESEDIQKEFSFFCYNYFPHFYIMNIQNCRYYQSYYFFRKQNNNVACIADVLHRYAHKMKNNNKFYVDAWVESM